MTQVTFLNDENGDSVSAADIIFASTEIESWGAVMLKDNQKASSYDTCFEATLAGMQVQIAEWLKLLNQLVGGGDEAQAAQRTTLNRIFRVIHKA